MVLFGAIAVLAVSIKCVLPRLLPMCLGKLPRDAVPLSAEDEAAWVDSLQGDWDIEAVDLGAIAQTNNGLVKPIGFKTAKVTGRTCVLGGGPRGRSSKGVYHFTRSPSTGLVYLDKWGSNIVTPGWPYTRPMQGQVGEILDFNSMGSSVRWTRRTASAAATGFGQVQEVAEPPQQPAGGGAQFCSRCGRPLNTEVQFCSACGAQSV